MPALVLFVQQDTGVTLQLRQSVRLDFTLLKAVLHVLSVQTELIRRGRDQNLAGFVKLEVSVRKD